MLALTLILKCPNLLKRLFNYLKNQNYVSLEAIPKNKPGKFDLFISPMPLGEQIIRVEYPIGPTGPSGIIGEPGETGSTGPTGSTGSRGNDGNSFQSITL